MPSSDFDQIFEFIETTNRLEEFLHTKGSGTIQLKKAVAKFDARLGCIFREAINRRQVHRLQEFATAVGLLKKHRPKPDYVLQAATILGGIAPSEIALSYAKGPVPLRDGEILWTPIPSSRKPCMDDIKKFIEHRIGRELTADEWKRDSKKAERHMKELDYWGKFDHRRGRKPLK
jgi:hypothetical protein